MEPSRRLLLGSIGLVLLTSGCGAHKRSAAPKIVEYGTGISAHATPVGIAAGPDDNVWFTEADGNRIGKITPSGRVSEYKGLTPHSVPNAIVAGPDGAATGTRPFDEAAR